MLAEAWTNCQMSRCTTRSESTAVTIFIFQMTPSYDIGQTVSCSGYLCEILGKIAYWPFCISTLILIGARQVFPQHSELQIIFTSQLIHTCECTKTFTGNDAFICLFSWQQIASVNWGNVLASHLSTQNFAAESESKGYPATANLARACVCESASRGTLH